MPLQYGPVNLDPFRDLAALRWALVWLLATALAACGAGAAADEGFLCPSAPTAYVFDPKGSDYAMTALAQAGFHVEPLPRDRSPGELRGLVLIGSDAAADPDYRRYMDRYAADFHAFVDRANLLVQFAQPPESESVPPFLPTTHTARRAAAAAQNIRIAQPDNPTLAGLSADSNADGWSASGMVDQMFVAQGGFEVAMVASGADGSQPLMLEGAYGQGRLILSGLRIDRATHAQATPEWAAFSAGFFDNLMPHVQSICERATTALQVTPATGASAFSEGSWKLAVMPDTQVYSLLYPGLFTAQTGWIAANAEQLDIRYAIHLGDIVNNNTHFEWTRASQAMKLLNGVVPIALVPGNHDYGPSGDASTRDTLLNQYFDYDTSAAMPTFGGAYREGELDNSYHLFSAAGRDFILVALEWGPRDEVIAWANEVMSRYPERDGIFVTHAYMNHNDRRYDHTATEYDQSFNPHEYATPGGVNDGEELWQKLIRRHRFVMTLSGHVLSDGTGYLVSETDLGTPCHQMLSNYQTRSQGGEGYLRVLEFLPDGETVKVFTYSPLYDDFLREPDQGFSFTLPTLATPQ